MIFQEYNFSTIYSTHSFLKDTLPHFDKQIIHIATADQQTRGRGQFDRIWLSPPGNLYISAATHCRSKTPILHMGLSLAAHVVTVLETLGIEAHIKWPNDVLVQKKKIAGVLGEVVQDQGYWHILSLGFNIAWAPKEGVCLHALHEANLEQMRQEILEGLYPPWEIPKPDLFLKS